MVESENALQLNLEDYINEIRFGVKQEDFVLRDNIKLIELFAGYGSQHLSLNIIKEYCEKVLNKEFKFESHKISEWAINSILAYKELHKPEDKTDYSKNLSKDEIVDLLVDKYCVSVDYSNPAKRETLKRYDEKKIREIYNALVSTNNLGSVTNINYKDLNITNREKNTYILTYSYPCQDISLAGDMKGYAEGSETRSGLLWTVGDILKECKENNCLPQVLLAENVPNCHSNTFRKEFDTWLYLLKDLGYTTFWADINAKNCGIPQNRNRTFILSFLGQTGYKFRKGIKLKYHLIDLLESNVDEKYYLSQKMIQYVTKTGTNGFNNCDSKINKEIARPLTTDQNKRAGTTNYIGDNLPEECDLNDNNELQHIMDLNYYNHDMSNEVYNKVKNSTFTQNQARLQEKDTCGTLCARDYKDPKLVIVSIPIKNATKEGFTLATEGDGIDISGRMEYHRGTVQKGITQTIDTQCNQGVVVYTNLKEELCEKILEKGLVEEGDVIRHSYTNNRLNNGEENMGRTQNKEKMSPTLDTRCDCFGVVVEDKESVYTETVKQNLRIRKLTPKECFRLQGVSDKDSDKLIKIMSNATLYHLAGDSICTTALVHVLAPIFKLNQKDIIEWYVDNFMEK